MASVSFKTHQGFDGAEIFDLVAAEVEMGEIGTFLCQYLQTTRDSVIAKLELLQTKPSILIMQIQMWDTIKGHLFNAIKSNIFVPF